MLSWAQTQKVKILGVAALLIAVVLAVWALLPERSSCGNGVRDGDERGVDCGGSCRLLCQDEARAPVVQFARAVPVSNSVWGAVAYVENKNENAGARSAPYVFKLYDAESLLLYERRGVAYIPPRKVRAVFEGRMDVGDRVPTRATFAFTVPPRFEVIPPEITLQVRNQRFTGAEGGSRLDAELVNPTQSALTDIEVTAALFDEGGNLFAASAARVPRLPPRGTVPLVFTWPEEVMPPARMEILYAIPGMD